MKKSAAQNKAPVEKVFDRILTPFEEFIHQETASGILLMIAAALALVAANSGLFHAYEQLLHVHVSLGVGDFVIDKTLHHWINDGLMTLFFFVVGLEIKREVLVGELADIRQAALPVVAAIGGMVMPALVYFLVAGQTDAASGWGIPMATDIAFAVGVMVLLGKRVPKSLLTFLVALAIVDDLGAVAVIALFYTESLHLGALGAAGGFLALMILFNLGGVRKPVVYFLAGVAMWLAMLESGIHATLAGVLTALAIPARSLLDTSHFSERVRELMDYFDTHEEPGASIMRNPQQNSALQTLENGVHLVETPLQRLEHNLHIPVAFLVIPIFAFANAGVPIEASSMAQTLTHPVALGVILGLLAGKVLGIAGFSYIALKLGIGQLPEGTRMPQLIGVGLLGGIGFTMSIFITELAFGNQEEYLLMAKTGILVASMVAGVGGYLWLLATSRPLREDG